MFHFVLLLLFVWCYHHHHHHPLQFLGSPVQGVHLGLNLPVRSLWRPVLFGEGLELQRVEGVFATAHVLHGVFPPAALAAEKQKLFVRILSYRWHLSPSTSSALPAHTVQRLVEDLWGQGVLLLQDLTLLQGQRHGCAVLGALTAGESHAVQTPACLRGLEGEVRGVTTKLNATETDE